MKPRHLEFSEVLEFFSYTVEWALNLEFLPFGTSSVDIPNLKDLKLGIQLCHMKKWKKWVWGIHGGPDKDPRDECQWSSLWKAKKNPRIPWVGGGPQGSLKPLGNWGATPPLLPLLLHEGDGNCWALLLRLLVLKCFSNGIILRAGGCLWSCSQKAGAISVQCTWGLRCVFLCLLGIEEGTHIFSI